MPEDKLIGLLEALRKTEAFLARKGVESPRLNAEHLFAHGLGCKRLELYLQYERPLTTPEQDAIRVLVQRRAAREPLQYILGTVDFAGLTLRVDRRALIPRPETEELAERIRNTVTTPPARILDLGTGTGALALALAAAFPQAAVTATDASEEALALARENAAANRLSDRVTFLLSDWFHSIQGSFDLLVSNPPYLTQAEWESAAPEVKDHDPRAALVAEEDGLADLRTIVEAAPAFLASGGLLALETGLAHHDRLAEIASATGAYGRWHGEADLTGRPRYAFGRRA